MIKERREPSEWFGQTGLNDEKKEIEKINHKQVVKFLNEEKRNSNYD